MSTALEAASLIMVPSGYEDGTLASVKPNDGIGDFTFSRGSNTSATRVNADGNIEKGYENLLLQSNSFDTNWAQVNLLPPTDGQSGYDGTTDAWYFEKVGAYGRLQQSISTSGVRTLSVYLKAKDSSWVSIEAAGTNTSRQYFDLTNISKGSSNNIISSSIEDAGDGWRRCSITYEGSKTLVFIFIAEGNGQVSGTTGSLYIQDAMLNQGLVAYPYIETTTAPVAGGILEDMPRLDYSNGSCPSLLLEPQRTNAFTRSEYYGPGSGWAIQTGVAITSNTNEVRSPEGVYNATKLVGNGTAGIYKVDLASGICARSVYLRSVSGSVSVVLKDPARTISVKTLNLTTEWTRYELVEDNTNPDFSGIWIANIPSAGIYMWGAQLEQATYPTSYIPTYGVSQTRAGDVCADAGDVSTFNSAEGVLYFEGERLSLLGNKRTISISDGSLNNYLYIQFQGVSNTIRIFYKTIEFGQVLLLNHNLSNELGLNKYAFRWSNNNFSLWINGTKELEQLNGSTATSNVLSELNFDVGNGFDKFYGDVKQVLVFPTALTDSECIELTTI